MITVKTDWRLLSFLLGISIVFGQSVGIGTAAPHSSARLHIEDTERGLLIPNVLLTATNSSAPVTGPATSLLVYNAATAGTPPHNVWPGFYYWDGSQWVRLLSGSGTSGDAWLLQGNSGTTPGTHFLGTTDNVALHIRVNNERALLIEPGSTPNLIGGHSGNSAGSGVVGATIGGGGESNFPNRVLSNYGTVGGGSGNDIGSGLNATEAVYATVSGGHRNKAIGIYSTVGGGVGNVARGKISTVSGGEENNANGPHSTVGGGFLNTADSDFSTVGGGIGNAARGKISTVSGGEKNYADGSHSTVGGGWGNAADGEKSTVSGGQENTASGAHSTVGGGEGNVARGSHSTVSGGQRNVASSDYITIGGGAGNVASGSHSTIVGGVGNIASGEYSTILGGSSNTANGSYNLVFGQEMDPSVNESYRVYFFGDGGASRPSGFLVINRLDGDHPIHVGTNFTNGNGAHLTIGGVWTNGSSRSFKERFVQYRPAEVLEKILQLPVEGYYYKGTEEYHITPMAEDFYRLFGTGVREIIETDSTGKLTRRPNPDVDKYLAASDVAGVALLGIKALAEENERLRQENAELRARLERENAELRARLERLEKLMQISLEQRASPH